MAGGTNVQVGCRNTDDAVVSLDTVNTVVSSLRPLKGVLSIFASSGQLGSLDAEETLRTKHVLIISCSSTSKTVLASITRLRTVKLSVLTVVTGGTRRTLV